MSCNLLPWIIPSPEALLVHKKVDCLGNDENTHYEMMTTYAMIGLSGQRIRIQYTSLIMGIGLMKSYLEGNSIGVYFLNILPILLEQQD
ncbi:MAG: hypothetical protein Ct9H90mP4_05700 [Gammaproteobacteria bacterium]|nr:MAG: hypothetical protein Ct9H90mP4_05700 [Gammaproteobacteria bacterium]